MKQIPKSSWVINKVYFKAKVVDDFQNKYLQWGQEEGCGFTDSEESTKEVIQFIRNTQKMSNQGWVWLYEYPAETNQCYCNDGTYARGRDNGDEYDYFEKYDDNYVIPRHLFVVI